MKVLLPYLGLLLTALATYAGPDIGAIESFDANVAGWEDRDAEKMLIQFDVLGNPGGAVSGVSSNLLAPIPETDALRAGVSASLGAFTGNYAEVFGVVAGWHFDFNARDVLPSSAFIRFGRGSNIFFRSFTTQLSQTNTWQPVFLRLDTAGDWLGGDVQDYTNALGNLDFVEVQVTRRGAGMQRYAVDNFSLLELVPETGALPLPSDQAFRMSWNELKTGFEYTVEGTTNLFDEWANVTNFLATNVLSDWSMPFDSNLIRRFYRIHVTDIPLE